MNVRQQGIGFLLALLTIGMDLPSISAADSAPASTKKSPGTIVGILRTADKVPVAGATVTAVNTGGAIRATVSTSDGVYSFADLEPGTWSLTIQVDGYPDVVTQGLQVAPGKATRTDIVVNAPAVVNAPPAPAVAPAPAAAESKSFTASIAAAVAAVIPKALQAPEAGAENDTVTPWANVGYVGWMNGTSREKDPIFDTKFFTPEIRFDANYLYDSNHPKDHTIDGSTEEFRSGEFQIEQVSLGGDFHWDGVRARFLSMFGLFSVTTPRNDASQEVGQWDLQGAYKYFSEANAGYHWDVAHGLNVDVGIFVSYIGLFSYYNFDNWTYQPSFVSSNTPWFFNGMRVQFWPTQDLKIEPWLINGWQSYAKFNSHPGFGGQILWIPNDSLKLVWNTYLLGQDNISNQFTNGLPNNAGNNGSQLAQIGTTNVGGRPVNWSKVQRIHEDDSILVKYYDNPQAGMGVTRMAMSLTVDIGCEYGGGVSCTGGPNKESFLGWMLYNRLWWDNNKFAVTLGGGSYDNPGRYLALTPPINGATAATGTSYFSEEPGMKLFQWDTQLNIQYMPKDWITWWTEATFRHSNVPYWSGSGGITAPGAIPSGAGAGSGNVNGTPGGYVCNDGTIASAPSCANDGGLWYPDLRTREIVFGAGVLVKF
jgi:Putative beta-barrel porin-2, OmpL-like. bbp2/Carboxypeptidase regulatory-like domain